MDLRRRKPKPEAQFAVVEKRPYQWWRDVVLVILAGTIFVLGMVVNHQGDDATKARATATAQRADQSRKLDKLTLQVAGLTRDNAAKDVQIADQAQTIRMLTAVLRANDIPIPATLQRRVQADTTSRQPSSAPSPQTSSPATELPATTPQPSTDPPRTPSPAPVVTPGLLPQTTDLLCLLVPSLC